MTARARRVVVIGAGMGGLAASIDLARQGCNVVLLERAEHAGGKVRALDVGGRAVDTGPTVFTMRWLFEGLFEDAGENLEEALELKPLDVLARHGWLDGSRLDLFADVDRSVEAIADFAGASEAGAYRRFVDQSRAIFDTLDQTFMRREKPGPVALGLSLGVGGIPRLVATQPFMSLWQALGKNFRDPRLRQLFGRYATYCGSSPWAAPATLQLIAHAERAGVWTVGGGMPRLADALAQLAERQGVDLRLGAGAVRIETVRGAVEAVLTEDGERLSADAVVFNGDAAALGQGLLGPEVAGALPDRSAEPRSLSAVTWSVVGKFNGFPLHHHTVLFGNDYDDEFRAIFDRGEITATPTIYLCAQDREAGVAPAQSQERVFLLVNAPPRALTPGALDAVEDRLYELLGRHGLELHVQAMQRTGPADWAKRFPGSSGALYGWPTHGWRGSFRRSGSRSDVRGLYLAGGTVHPGPGIPMALQSGRIAARAVLEDA